METDAWRPSQDGTSDQVSGDPFYASSKHTVNLPKQFFNPPCSWVFISHVENHWQTVSSLEDFMVFLDLKLNPAEEGKDWIFVLELASIHRAAEFRARLLNTFTSCTSQPNRHLASPATWP